MYNFPSLISQLNFRPRKKPCINVHLVNEENEFYIYWTPGKASRLAEEEIPNFINDTGDLLLKLGEFSVTLGWNYDRKDLLSKYGDFDLQCVMYWEKWGPLYPIPGKKYLSDTNTPFFKTKLVDVIALGLTDLFISVFWHSPEDEFVIESLERFFALVESCNQYYANHPDEKSEKPTIWYASPTKVNNYPLIDWFHSKEKSGSKGLLGLYMLHPSDKELENILSDDEAKIDWVKKNILQNIADYINKQKIAYKSIVLGNEVHLEGETSDLFLSYVIGFLMEKNGGRKAKFCECGCGRLVPPGRDKYASEACRQRLRDKGEKRTVKKWLRTNKNRGKMSQEQYEKLCHRVDEMFLEGYSQEEMKSELKDLF